MKKKLIRLYVLLLTLVMAIGVMSAPAAVFAEDADEYVYGTVDMNYADFYFGELEGIEPSDAAEISTSKKDPVTEAGYREEGYYDAATFATPRGFIYEKKWQTWPGVYTEPIYDEWDNLVGGKILGVASVNVAVKKSVYDAAMAAPKTNVGKKATKIVLNKDQSQVPLSYKVLNPDGVYSKYVGLTEDVDTDLDGYLTTEFMGDDIWWEGNAMKHTNEQTILGGVIEYKEDPNNPEEKPVVLGLKHNENMYSDTWIGWGMGPGNVGIYGGNETGWQRFGDISGKYLTKMSYILMEEDGSVHYYNASYNAEKDTTGEQREKLLNPFVPSSVKDNRGNYPYSAGITNYEFTKDRIILDMEISVPLRQDGTLEAQYYLRSLNCPGGGLTMSGDTAAWKTNPEKVPVYEESEWVNGKKTYHIEIARKYMDGETEKYFGTGRYKYWFNVDKSYEKKEGDRPFTGVAAWKMLYTDETPDDIYLKDNKLVVNSDLFTVSDYMNNPYQQIEVYDAKTGEQIDVFATGDANTNTTLFLGTKMKDETPVKGLFAEDGTINMDAQHYYTKGRGSSAKEYVEPVFEDPEGTYGVVLYSGGFPIVRGTVSKARQNQEITVAEDSYKKSYGDPEFSLGAEAKTKLSYKSDDKSVATVDKNGVVTLRGTGACTITITAAESAEYNKAEKKVAIEVGIEDYVFGTVDMDYADFYYGELERIEPSDAEEISPSGDDPVTKAGYREEGYYDAATFATPRGFIYEKKWQTWPGVFTEPIYDEWNNLVGGKILGVSKVNVAIKKTVYEAALKAPDSAVGKKAAEIELNKDQSQVPLSFKVLNPDGVYSKYANLTDSVETKLDGYLTTEFMGDDIWWEGNAMKHTKEQTILGGVIEYKADPYDEDEEPVVLGLKHNENMYSDTWIGWGMGPGNVGIYGGNETGWQRFAGISGKYLTKMSYILMEEDGSVHYYNASSKNGLLNPYVPSGVIEDGKHPYSAGITNYEFTKDRIKIDMEISVPVRADGTPEAGYFLYSINAPGGGLTMYGDKAAWKTNPEKVPVYEESEWVNGKKTYHIEIARKYMDGETEKYFGTGRYKYWFDIDPAYEKQKGDREFTGVAAWKMLYTDETPDDIYLKGNKLVVNSDIFTVSDYMNNPYQQIEVYDAKTGEQIDVFATGDANTNSTLFLGTKMLDETPVKGLFAEDGTINMDAQKYSYNRRTGKETVEPIFEDPDGKYEVVLYSGGFPIVRGTVSSSRENQSISGEAVFNKVIGDEDFSLGAEAKTALSYESSDDSIATVSEDGKVSVKSAGTCKITVKAKETADYNEAEKEVEIIVAKKENEIQISSDSFTKVYGSKDFNLNASAKTDISYQSNMESVAAVSSDGTVKIVGVGKCVITIKAAETDIYKEASKDIQLTVTKKAPTITAKKNLTVKASALKKKAKKVSINPKSNSGGKITCTKKAGKKFFKVAKNGKITVKKGTKKGSYTVKVKIKCAAKGNYKAGSKIVKVKIKVK